MLKELDKGVYKLERKSICKVADIKNIKDRPTA